MNEETQDKLRRTTKDLCNMDVSYWLAKAFTAGFVLGKYEPQLTQFIEKYPDMRVDLDHGVELIGGTREAVIDFIRIFGGNWKKELEDYRPGKIRYSQTVEIPFIPNGQITLAASDAPPPPSCQIIEEEVDVPATKIKKKRIVCPGNEIDKAEDEVAQPNLEVLTDLTPERFQPPT